MTTTIVAGQQWFDRRFVPTHPQRRKAFVWTGRGVKAPVLTLTAQSVYPSRALVTVSGLDVGMVVTVSRTPAGSTTRTTVRGGNAVTATTDALVLVDAEAPYGVLLTYYLTILPETGTTAVDYYSATITLTLAGGKVALTNAITGDAAEVVVLAWPSKRRERASSVFAVGGRNIVVSGPRGGFSGTIDLFTETDEAKALVLNLLANATSGVLQIRQAGPYDGVDAYISVLADEEQRYSQDGSDERRILSLDVVETQAWAPTLETPTFTLQDIADAYPIGTLDDIDDDYVTLLDLGAGDFS